MLKHMMQTVPRVANRTSCVISRFASTAPAISPLDERPIYSAEHEAFRDSARKFFQTLKPRHAAWEETGVVSKDAWLEAGRAGMLGITVPEKYGGAGCDWKYAAIAIEEQARLHLSGPGFPLHSEICIPYILKYGTEEQKQRWVPKMVSGEFASAIAMSEPAAGSDLQGIRTTATATPDGKHYILNGQKTFITNGQNADLIIVVCKTDPSKGAKGTSLIVVETNGQEGFTRGRNLKKLGLKAQDTSELFFDNCKVPAENVLGSLNKGFIYLMQELAQERLIIAVASLADAEGVFEQTLQYTKDRKVFGQTVSNFQTTRFKLAEMKTELAVTRTFVDRCVQLIVEKKLDPATASMAKYWSSDMLGRVADGCLQLHGGYGFMWEYDVCKVYADARVQRIYGGTNEIMKELIARSLGV